MKLKIAGKVNLSLQITGRRADGYHLLDMVMCPVSLYDEMTLEPARELDYQPPGSVPREKDLVWRAAALLQREAGVTAGASITLQKAIPFCAGLGGASADASAVLLGLNALWGLHWPRERLLPLALSLGADLPFFLYSRPARVRGIGERLDFLDDFPKRYLALAKPEAGVSTPLAYKAFDEGDYPSAAHTDAFPAGGKMGNDLQAPVAALCPEVDRLLREIGALHPRETLMSGAGSACFGIFASRAEAEKAAEALRELGYWARAVETLNA